MLKAPLQRISAGVLEVAFHAEGPADGAPVFLMHGFPYDIHAYAEVAPRLADRGCRVFVPCLRGFGGTRFLRADTPRSGEQAALGHDLKQLMDALRVPRAVLAGYDWGGRAACVVAALWPGRCAGLLSVNSYNIQHIASAMTPDAPRNEHRLWYQYYFHSERGRRGLEQDRRGLCRLLWQLWSPTWRFDDATFERSAAAFDNPDFRAGAAAADQRARADLRRGRRRRAPAGSAGAAGATLHRRPQPPRSAGRGAQRAAGSAGAVCRRGAVAGAGRRACVVALTHARLSPLAAALRDAPGHDRRDRPTAAPAQSGGRGAAPPACNAVCRPPPPAPTAFELLSVHCIHVPTIRGRKPSAPADDGVQRSVGGHGFRG